MIKDKKKWKEWWDRVDELNEKIAKIRGEDSYVLECYYGCNNSFYMTLEQAVDHQVCPACESEELKVFPRSFANGIFDSMVLWDEMNDAGLTIILSTNPLGGIQGEHTLQVFDDNLVVIHTTAPEIEEVIAKVWLQWKKSYE